MRKRFKVPYSFTYGGSLGRKTKNIEILFTESNGNIVVESAEGDQEAIEVFKSEVLGSYSKRSGMENYLRKIINEKARSIIER